MLMGQFVNIPQATGIYKMTFYMNIDYKVILLIVFNGVLLLSTKIFQ